jgi:hypothetical protein
MMLLSCFSVAETKLYSSCAGLTRASILQKKMDCRVKPGNDEMSAALGPAISTVRS